MLHSKFQEVLNHFNYLEDTSAMCEGVFMNNFIVSGLLPDEVSRLSLIYRYNPARHLGTSIISREDYAKITTKATTTYFDISVDGVSLNELFGSSNLMETKEPAYTNMLLGNTGGDLLDSMMGRVTNGKLYEIVEDLGWLYKIVDDRGIHGAYHYSWFTNVKLYDEDETQLTCREITFNLEDYIDLRKHTPDQIRQIAKFYQVYKLEEVLTEGVDWRYLSFDGVEFDSCPDVMEYTLDGEEYTFNDIFYLEE